MRARWTLAVVMIAATLPAAASDPPKEILSFATRHWATEPETRIADAYKWLFHATQGGEHAITSPDGPRQWLDDEWKTLGKPKQGEPLLVPLVPDGSLVRVNLRPYKAAKGSKARMLGVFVASAKSFRPDRSRFVKVWSLLGERLSHRAIGKLTLSDWRKFDKEMRPLGYPTCDHSPEYEKAYRPAYRVVLRSIFAPKRP